MAGSPHPAGSSALRRIVMAKTSKPVKASKKLASGKKLEKKETLLVKMLRRVP